MEMTAGFAGTPRSAHSSFPLSLAVSNHLSLSQNAEPSPSPKDPHIQLSSLWLSASYSCINIRIILFHSSAQYSQWRDSISMCEIKPQDLFFILKGYSRDSVLDLQDIKSVDFQETDF